jgi:Uma2 family endonuclease
MALQRKSGPALTPEEYLRQERDAETKSEYWNGEVYALAGATRTHNRITVNMLISLGNQLKGSRCTLYPSDMRVKVQATGLYTYPDMAVVCGKERFEGRHSETLLNPTVIVEVLSPSTEAYDRGAKFVHYRQLPSLTDYLLIAQEQPAVDHFVRQGDGNWLLVAYAGLDAVVQLASVDCTLALADVYDKVEWTEGGAGLRHIDEEEAEYDAAAEI